MHEIRGPPITRQATLWCLRVSNEKEPEMGGGHNFEKFKAAILALSNATDWLEAKPEWELHIVYNDGSDRSCE